MNILTIDSAPIGLAYSGKKYLIGFASPVHARKVQYTIKMPFQNHISMLPGVEPLRIKLYNRMLVCDKEATLFVHKNNVRRVVDNVLDQGMCLEKMDEEEFMLLPFHGVYGVMLPTKVIDETDDDITFRCVTIDPMNDNDDDIKDSVRVLFE